MEENKIPEQDKGKKEINNIDRDSSDHAKKQSSSEQTHVEQPFEDQKIVFNGSVTRKAEVLSYPESSTIEAQQIPIANINEAVKEKGDSISSAYFKDSEAEKWPKGDIKTGSKEATKSGKDHPERDTVLSRYHSLKHEKGLEQKRQNNNVSTIITIGYTVLILILGFLVYRDLSKRLNNLEEKVLRIEMAINKVENIPLKEIERYDLH